MKFEIWNGNEWERVSGKLINGWLWYNDAKGRPTMKRPGTWRLPR